MRGCCTETECKKCTLFDCSKNRIELLRKYKKVHKNALADEALLCGS